MKAPLNTLLNTLAAVAGATLGLLGGIGFLLAFGSWLVAYLLVRPLLRAGRARSGQPDSVPSE